MDKVEGKPRGCMKTGCLYGCLPLLVLISILLGFLWFQARGQIQERSLLLRKEISEFEAEGSGTRPVLFGAALPGNAADEYWLINYVLSPPSTWDKGIPVGIAPTKFSYRHAETNRIETVMASIDLVNRVKAKDRSEPTGDGARFLKVYGPLADQLRVGLRKERCVWNSLFEKGFFADMLNLMEARGMANLMVYQAFMAEEGTDIEKALEVIVFGRDLARNPNLGQAMVGNAVQGIGAEALEQFLARPLPESAYAQVIDVLGRLEPVNVERALVADRLFLSVHLAALGGEPVFNGVDPGDMFRVLGTGEFDPQAAAMKSRIFLGREWAVFDRFHERSLEIGRLPYSQRAKEAAKFDAELGEAWSFLARSLSNVHEACSHVEALEARLQALRMLAAAQLVRLKAGAFPKNASALKSYLKAIPRDPFLDRKKPLAYSESQGTVTVKWSYLGKFVSTTAPKKE